jgi:hypothetical protein
MCTILWGRLHFVYDVTLFFPFIHQRLLCFVSHSNGMTSCQSSSTENVSCNVVLFFYHQCGDTTSCIRHIVSDRRQCGGTKLCIRSCLLRDLTASQIVAIATRSDTASHNRLDLIQSLVPPHYVCNGYVLTEMGGYNCFIIFQYYYLSIKI